MNTQRSCGLCKLQNKDIILLFPSAIRNNILLNIFPKPNVALSSTPLAYFNTFSKIVAYLSLSSSLSLLFPLTFPSPSIPFSFFPLPQQLDSIPPGRQLFTPLQPTPLGYFNIILRHLEKQINCLGEKRHSFETEMDQTVQMINRQCITQQVSKETFFFDLSF